MSVEMGKAENLWDNDSIQFPRLLAEITATQDLDVESLANAMDLGVGEVGEILERAQGVWQSFKGRVGESVG